MYADYSCNNYKCEHADSLYKDCNDYNKWVCVDANTKAYADYTCTSDGCDYTLTNHQDCTYACSDGECVTSATVHGYMRYSNGSGVSNVKFKLEDCGTGSAIAYDYTDGEGYYSIDADAGDYVLSADYLEMDIDFTNCRAFYGDISVNDIVLSANVSGYVKYSSGLGRSGVVVRLKACSDELIDSYTTNNDGYYYLSDPDAGYYKVTMELHGYEFEVYQCQSVLSGMTAPDVVFDASLSGYIQNYEGVGKHNVPVKLTDCDVNTVDTDTTNSEGYFELESADADYFDFYFNYMNHDFQALDCRAIVGDAQFSEPIILYTTLHGYIKDLNNKPLEGYAVELYDCSENFIESTQTSASGYFSITQDAEKYKIMINPGGWRIKLVDESDNDCFFLFGDIDVGDLNINPTPDCSIFDYTCYQGNIKLFGCYWNDEKKGCYCYGTECLYGCTDGALQCDLATKGKLYIDVDNTNDNYRPLAGAKIYLDNSYKGVTDSNGKKTIDASYGFREVKVNCPNDNYCDTQTPYISGDTYLYFDCDCYTTPQSTDLRIKLKTIPQDYAEGYRIANVYVVIDDDYKGLTNQFGLLDIPLVGYGEHRLEVYLNIADDEGGKPSLHYGSTLFQVNEEYSEQTFVIQKEDYGAQNISHLIIGKTQIITLSEYGEEATQQLLPAVVVGALVIGGFIWDLGDFTQCATESESWWGSIGEYAWSKLSCAPYIYDKDKLAECNKKFESINQNALEKCKLKGAMLAANFIPAGWIIKGGKLAIKFGKLTRILPHVDDAFKGGYRVIKQVGNKVTITDGVQHFRYTLISGSVKLTDNIAGMITKIAKKAPVNEEIAQKVANMLKEAKPFDIPRSKQGSVGSIQGVLGEKAGDDYIDFVKRSLESEKAVVKKVSGKADTVYKESEDYLFKHNDVGGIDIFWKHGTKEQAGEIDRLIFVNEKPVIFEVKGGSHGSIVGKLNPAEIYNNKIVPLKQLTGKDPEFVLLVPKGESAQVAKQISDMVNGLGNRGISYVSVDELPATAEEFEKAARRINNALRGG
jgi:hypothetical protein